MAVTREEFQEAQKVAIEAIKKELIMQCEFQLKRGNGEVPIPNVPAAFKQVVVPHVIQHFNALGFKVEGSARGQQEVLVFS